MSQIVIPKTMVIEKGGVTFIFTPVEYDCTQCLLWGIEDCYSIAGGYCEHLDYIFKSELMNKKGIDVSFDCTEVRNERY